ncbi:MAG: Endo,4-beta-mannosidase [Myxococcales bacterium]|nr:Endo,4-beta-mannosidase [Myxococcales bacterium]
MHSLLLALTTLAAIPDGAFVRAEGGRFTVGGQPFVFVGANLDVMHGAGERARVEDTLGAARADGLTVGRVWALGEGDAASPPWSRAHQLFRVAPEAWLDAGYDQLDRVLAAARARGLRLIITLSNYWDDFGGIRQYLAWAGLSTEGFANRDRFFSDPKVRTWFRAHLLRLVERTNRITGVRYADDPTIFAWELMNESQVTTADGALARRAWIDEMATFLRSRDPQHLVTPGVMGYTTRAERAEWLAICRLPSVDYCDSHLYPETTDRVTTQARLEAYIDDRVQLARWVAKKPIVFGEFGFHTDAPAWLERPRADWFAAFLARALFDGAGGALAWIYQPWNGHARDFGIYVDRPDTDDVRAELRRFAAVAAAPAARENPLLGEAHGDALFYDPYVAEARSPHQHDVPGAVEIPPGAFASGRWERLGSWGAGATAHAYGAADGWFDYSFTLTRGASPTLVARLSSEWPGSSAPADGGSDVVVSVDGVRVATLGVIADDGLGRQEHIALGKLHAGRHVVRLAVEPSERAHGLCIYGDERAPMRIVTAAPTSR